jgi:serine/threonine protein kinase
MDQNELQGKWIVSQQWLPQAVIDRAFQTCNKSSRDLSEVLAERGLLTRSQAVQVQSAVDQLFDQAKQRDDGQVTYDELSGTRSKSAGAILKGKQFANFSIIEFINRGGMGLVVKAHDNKLQEEVALKLLLTDPNDETASERFRREAQALGQLRHPNIVQLRDFGVDGGILYLVLDYVNGKDLATITEAKSKRGVFLETNRLVKIMTVVAQTLSYCHEQGIIHRDIKPANIILEQGTFAPFLVDFGVVKAASHSSRSHIEISDEALSSSGEIIGTPAFISPEQIDPLSEAGPFSDVWGFAATLFYCLTGQLPFPEGGGSLLIRLMTQDAARLKSIRNDIPSALDQLVADCLQRETGSRPTMLQVVKRLEDFQVAPKRKSASVFLLLLFLIASVTFFVYWSKNFHS